MTTRINFDSTDAKLSLASARAAVVPFRKRRERFTVTSNVKDAADQTRIEMARDLEFSTGRPYYDALIHVCPVNSEVLALSRADARVSGAADIGGSL